MAYSLYAAQEILNTETAGSNTFYTTQVRSIKIYKIFKIPVSVPVPHPAFFLPEPTENEFLSIERVDEHDTEASQVSVADQT